MKLDIYDKRILYELDLNSRQEYSVIAKKVRLSKETVRNRILAMQRDGIIKKFFALVNPFSVGLVFHKVLLRLHNLNPTKLSSMLNWLSTHKQIAWLVEIDGSFDIGFVVCAESLQSFDKFLQDFYSKFSDLIGKQEISSNILGNYLPRDYLVEKARASSNTPSYSFRNPQEVPQLDELDKKILSSVAEDSRASALSIAEKYKVSPDTVIRRLRNLEKLHVLNRYNLVLNHSALNQLHYKVLISLNHFVPERVDALIRKFSSLPNIVYIIKSLGPWNFEIDVEVPSVEKLRSILGELNKEFFDIIKDYDSLLIRKIHKYRTYEF